MVVGAVGYYLEGLLELIGVEDTPTFTRSKIVNQSEETNMVLASAQYLDDETILRKLPFITADEVDDILERRGLEEYDRFGEEEDGQETQANGEETSNNVQTGEEGT